jgi:hypothetical protein
MEDKLNFKIVFPLHCFDRFTVGVIKSLQKYILNNIYCITSRIILDYRINCGGI